MIWKTTVYSSSFLEASGSIYRCVPGIESKNRGISNLTGFERPRRTNPTKQARLVSSEGRMTESVQGASQVTETEQEGRGEMLQDVVYRRDLAFAMAVGCAWSLIVFVFLYELCLVLLVYFRS